MFWRMVILAGMMGSLLCAQPGPTSGALRTVMARLRPLHHRKEPPKAGDWLALHAERGQTFQEYLACDPVLPRGTRTVVYLQPLGAFTADQRRLVQLTGEFLGLFYRLPVKMLPDLPPETVPLSARRIHPVTRERQMLTSFVLQEVLRPRLPEDAAAMLALTAWDLWPREGWNFVFGEASLSERVGVWSIYRFGNPSQNPETFRLCLLRTLGTAVHETGHMFSMLHCTRWECVMCGSESLEESDRQPLEACPECLAKICWATRADPVARFQGLADFCQRNGLAEEEAFYRASIRALTTMPGKVAKRTHARTS